MILEFEDYYGNTIGAINISEKYINNRNLSIENTKGNISICDYDFDDIFGTNDEKIRISFEDIKFNNRKKIAEEIVDDIVSCRKGLIYDEEILDMFINDFYQTEMEKIRNIVDDMMDKHLEEDNLTIR